MAKPDYSKIFIKEACPTSIGGQAVMEGVMMQGPDRVALAMRIPSGELYLKTTKKPAQPAVMKYPVIRGAVAFFRSLIMGMSTLMESADILEKYAPEQYAEEPGKVEKWIDRKFGARAAWNFLMVTALVFAIVISVVAFVIFPTWIVNFLGKVIRSTFVLNLIEGLLRIALFVAYVAAIRKMEDIRTLFGYHGAEHKTIHCFENNLELTPENAEQFSTLHPRCGTSFIVFVLIISLLLFSFLGWPNLALRILSRILLIPVIAGLSYELLKWAGRSDGRLVRILSYPGLMLQNLTTAEPTREQLEVAILSLKAVLVDPDKEEIEGFVDKDGRLAEEFSEDEFIDKELSEEGSDMGTVKESMAKENTDEVIRELSMEDPDSEEGFETAYPAEIDGEEAAAELIAADEPESAQEEKAEAAEAEGVPSEAETAETETAEAPEKKDEDLPANPSLERQIMKDLYQDPIFDEEPKIHYATSELPAPPAEEPEPAGVAAKFGSIVSGIKGFFSKGKTAVTKEAEDYDLWTEGSALLSKKMPEDEEKTDEESINEAIKFLNELDHDGYTIVTPSGTDVRSIAQGIADHYTENAKERTLARRFTNDIRTIENALKWGQAALSMVENGKNEALMIMSYATGLSHAQIITRGKELMNDEDFKVFDERVQARLTGTPIQYILGMQEFMGLPFRVNPSVLIPRQDTEVVVEHALDIIREKGWERPDVLDMCTGSGAIGISIAAKVPLSIVTLADSSEEALRTAMINAKINEVNRRCLFYHGDMFDALPEDKIFDIIVINPPYIETDEIETLDVEVKDHEPRAALDGGKDGLDYYRIIADRASSHLRTGGMLVLEIGSEQAGAVKRLLMKARTFKDIHKHRDLAGRDRVIVAERM